MIWTTRSLQNHKTSPEEIGCPSKISTASMEHGDVAQHNARVIVLGAKSPPADTQRASAQMLRLCEPACLEAYVCEIDDRESDFRVFRPEDLFANIETSASQGVCLIKTLRFLLS